jgi:hypothetical protein
MKLIITVDTEFSTHKEDMGIVGRIGDNEYGLSLIGEILNAHDLKATFFVDVYTHKDQYVHRLINACKELQDSGHDLELHTHPNGIFDSKREGMAEYALNEQIDIIRKGKEIFRQWFGREPLAHRAGDWAANSDTLKALKDNEIACDLSHFYGWKHCPLNELSLTKNSPVEYDGVLEIPATVFRTPACGLFEPIRLVSTDGNPYDETLNTIEKFKRRKTKVITLVFHSFSFIRWDKTRTHYSPSINRINKFKQLMQSIADDSGIEVKTAQEVFEQYKKDKETVLNSPEFVPFNGFGTSLLRLIDRFDDRCQNS